MSHDENTHLNCLPTSLLDYFVVTRKTPVAQKRKSNIVICLVLGLQHKNKVVLLNHKQKMLTQAF